ncbi:MAG: PHP domain-containing protein, partial [Phycisphaerales bacterium]
PGGLLIADADSARVLRKLGGLSMNRIKTLIHTHTDYSYDSNISLQTLARFAESERFGCLAVTDHDTIEGALRLRSMTDAKVIVGEEITTRDGHLIGLFLKERIPPDMSAHETVRAIRAQGGLVFLPHPFVKMFGCGVGKLAWELADVVDAVEVNNAQNLRRIPEQRAHDLADQFNLPAYVGSDCHIASSIAPCYQVMPDFDGPAEFLESLRVAELTEGHHPLGYFVQIARQILRSMARMPLPVGVGTNSPVDYLGTPRPVPVMAD